MQENKGTNIQSADFHMRLQFAAAEGVLHLRLSPYGVRNVSLDGNDYTKTIGGMLIHPTNFVSFHLEFWLGLLVAYFMSDGAKPHHFHAQGHEITKQLSCYKIGRNNVIPV